MRSTRAAALNAAFPGSATRCTRTIDPRTPRSYELAEAEGLLGPHLAAAADRSRRCTKTAAGRHLPINGAGAGGAALVDIGVPPEAVRGVVLIARTAGLVAHLVEEASRPLGMPLWLEVEHRARAKADPSRASAGGAELLVEQARGGLDLARLQQPRLRDESVELGRPADPHAAQHERERGRGPLAADEAQCTRDREAEGRSSADDTAAIRWLMAIARSVRSWSSTNSRFSCRSTESVRVLVSIT